MLGAVAGVAAAGVAGALAWATRARSSQWFAPSVYRGPRDRATLALTFDDGPSESTPQLLEVLAAHGVPATFFQCGAHVCRLPRIAREVAAAGHEIGNHTFSHSPLYCRRPSHIYREMMTAQQAIEQTTGLRPVWFRPPYGVRWFGLGEAQARLGLTGVMWTVLALDWALPAPRIVRRVLRRVANGSILCFHDGRELRANPDIRPTLDAVAALVPALAGRGFRFATLSQLICPKN